MGGLFGCVYGGTIKNLFITDSSATQNGRNEQNVAGLAVGALVEGGRIERVSASGTSVYAVGASKVNWAGGLVGLLGGTVNECSVTCPDISAGSHDYDSCIVRVGGLVGGMDWHVSNNSITNSYVIGSVRNTQPNNSAVLGGLLGTAEGVSGFRIQNCYAFGNVTVKSGTTDWWPGLLIGIVPPVWDVSNCFAIKKNDYPSTYISIGSNRYDESYYFLYDVSNFKGYASTLGSSFKEAPIGTNQNNPILVWEAEYKNKNT